MELPEVSLWYTDERRSDSTTSEAVVFLHPDTGSSQSWTPQLLPFITANYRLIAIDQRGRGQSKSILPTIPDGACADDLLAVLNHLDLEAVHIVATALGAFDAIQFATRHPERVTKLVLANTAGGISDQWYANIVQHMWTPEILALPPHQLELSPAYRGANPEGTKAWIEMHHRSRLQPGLVRETEAANRLADLELLSMPVLLIAGDADLLAPPRLMQHLADRIPGSQFTVIPNTGHSSSWEAPEVFNEIVFQFLANTVPAQAGRADCNCPDRLERP
ncbi:alpha/beta fold hydrolase [Paenarthrobacter ureafaciens]|uniref:alpha/beta fold hydrolase n=1 Tax=Paenarthrobacter ureafaciens TaxID=37931 RepID=UPI001C2BAA53|nr:alpha/beta hydrolase [Paenarthrobacter ureafaciens]